MKRKPTSQNLLPFLLVLAIATGIAISIRQWILEPFQIPNSAMKPTLLPGDTIFVWKLPFNAAQQPQTLKRGELIVFSSEQKTAEQQKTYWIRRIIGLPGERVSMKNGQISLNAKPSQVKVFLPSAGYGQSSGKEICGEENLPGEAKSIGVCLKQNSPGEFSEQTIPAESYLVVSDWRSNTDAEHPLLWTIVSKNQILGQPWVIWLSIDYTQQNQTLPAFRWKRFLQKIE